MLTPEFTAAAQRITAILRRSKEGKNLSRDDQAFCARIAAALDPEKKPVGRPRDADSARLPVYNNMAECAGATGIPLPMLKAAKKAGTFAGDWNRIDLAKFLRWVFAQDGEGDDGIDWSNELKKWLAKRAKIAHDRDAKKVMPQDAAETAIRSGVALLFAELDRVFGSELPPVLKGRTEPEIHARCQADIERLKQALREKFSP